MSVSRGSVVGGGFVSVSRGNVVGGFVSVSGERNQGVLCEPQRGEQLWDWFLRT